MKHLLIFTLLLLIAGCSDTPEKGVKPAPVEVITTTLSEISTPIEALGSCAADESITITPHAAGFVEKIHFSDGQRVDQGITIIELDHDEEKAQLKAAEAQLAEHLNEIKRLKRLLAKRAAAQRDLDASQTQAEISRSLIAEIRARIDDRVLRAPFAGLLGIRNVSPGAYVAPGDIITTLDATDQIKLEFSIPSIYLAAVNRGMAITASSDALAGEQFSGSISSIDSRIDSDTRTIRMQATIANRDGRLKPGMLMRITLKQQPRKAILVPEESITQRKDAHFVTLISADSSIEMRKVTIGQRLAGSVEIVEGLNTDEQVVTRGMGFLRPGQKVTIQQHKTDQL